MTGALALARLGDWLTDELAAAPPGQTAVLAGHYAIFSSGAAAVDLLEDSVRSPDGATDMIAFTRFTWELACDAIARQDKRHARLLVLVDDIQFVQPALDDRSASERLGAALAANYVSGMHTLPEFHSRGLRRRGLGDEQILRQADDRWAFSERELRTAAVRHVREQLRTGSAARTGLSANADESRIEVTLPEHGAYCLVHSGRTSCAGGYLELLSEVHRRGVRTLIAFVPMRCLGPVTVGAALAHRLYALPELSVVTVAVPDISTGAAAAVVREHR